MLLVDVSLSINLASLTIEQVIGKRRKLLTDMLPGLEAELRQRTEAEGLLPSSLVDKLIGRLRSRCESGPLCHPAEHYNADEALEEALRELLALSRGFAPGKAERVRERF